MASTDQQQQHDGAATPVNHDTVALSENDASDKISHSPSTDNDGPLHKSLTESTGKAEPENVSRDGDLENSKPAHVQDESKLLHGSEWAGLLL